MNERLLRIILLVSLFFVPLLGVYQSFSYEYLKVLFFILSTSLIGLLWLFTKPILKWDLIKIASFVFVLTLFIASSLGVDFRSSFLGREPYFQGLALYAYLFLFSLIVSSVAVRLEHVAMVLAGSAIIVSLVAMEDWILINIFNIPVQTYAGRVVSTFGQPNFYAGFLLLALPFSLYLVTKINNAKYLGYFSLIGGLVGILISGSRTAIMLAAALLVFWILGKFRTNRMFLIGIAVFLVVIGSSLYLSKSFSSGFVWQEIIEPQALRVTASANPSDPVEKRYYIWPIFWELINQSPFLGYGLENISASYAKYFETNKHAFFEETLTQSAVLIRLRDLFIDRTHNYTLDILMFSGIVGFLSWGVLVYLIMRKIRHGVVLVGLIFYLIWIQFQNQSIVHLIYFWLFAGLASRQSKDGP